MQNYLVIDTLKNICSAVVSWDGEAKLNLGENHIAVVQDENNLDVHPGDSVELLNLTYRRVRAASDGKTIDEASIAIANPSILISGDSVNA